MITARLFAEAIQFATLKHMGQYRKGNGHPYIVHPMSVMLKVNTHKKSDNIWLLGTAAILHDTVEDCGVQIEEITQRFGLHVAALVQELTLDKSQYEIIGKTEYLKQQTLKMSSYALVIKLCDRLDNVSDLTALPREKQLSYVKETYDILANLENRKLTATHKKIIKLIYKEAYKVEIDLS